MRWIIVLALGLLGGCSSAGQTPASDYVVPEVSRSCPSDAGLARWVSLARIVAIGTTNVDMADLAARFERSPRGFVPVTFRVSRWLKGSGGDTLTIEYNSDPKEGGVPLDQLGTANGQESLLYAFHNYGETTKLYLMGKDGLAPADTTSVDQVVVEITRQRTIVAGWSTHPYLPHYAEVKALISQITAIDPRDRNAAKRQQALFDRIEALGLEAVPALVDLMDDRRPLAVHSLGLVNKSPDAFEGMRWYGPRKVVDAVAAMLNQITGQHFGFIYGGASDTERDATVAGWRVYANDLQCAAPT